MKNYVILAVMLICGLMFGATAARAEASEEAKARCALLLTEIGTKFNLELEYADLDSISKGSYNKYTADRKGRPTRYIFVATGFDDSADLDLYVAKMNGDILARDSDNRNEAVVQYTFPRKGRYFNAVTTARGTTEYCYGAFRK